MAVTQVSFIDHRTGAVIGADPVINVGDVVDFRIGLLGEGALLSRVVYTGNPTLLTFVPGASSLISMIVSDAVFAPGPVTLLRVQRVELSSAITWLKVKE